MVIIWTFLLHLLLSDTDIVLPPIGPLYSYTWHTLKLATSKQQLGIYYGNHESFQGISRYKNWCVTSVVLE